MSDVTDTISQLINRGKFNDAVRLGRQNERSDASESAHFWFQYGLARRCAGLDGTVQYLCALDHEDCTPQMKGDIWRDTALIVARRGDLAGASVHLSKSLNYVGDDINRLAAIHMASARVGILFGKFDEALEYHAYAHLIWQQAGPDADRQWVMNNRFYWLRAKALLEQPRRIVYDEFVRSPEPRADRRRAAAAFMWTGPIAASVSLAREHATNEAFHIRALFDEGLSELSDRMEFTSA